MVELYTSNTVDGSNRGVVKENISPALARVLNNETYFRVGVKSFCNDLIRVSRRLRCGVKMSGMK